MTWILILVLSSWEGVVYDPPQAAALPELMTYRRCIELREILISYDWALHAECVEIAREW